MSYQISVRRKTVELDKYCFKNSSMAGEEIVGIWDTEEELAYFAFFNMQYKLGVLNSVCSYNYLYNPEGKRLNDNELNQIIKKYFPEETEKIDKRIKLGQNKFVKIIMNFTDKIIKYWITYEEDLIEKMSNEKKQKYEMINNKSEQYIQEIFGQKEYLNFKPNINKETTNSKNVEEDLEIIASRKNKI